MFLSFFLVFAWDLNYCEYTILKDFMYRVIILLLLAIGAFAFAVDSSESILQATMIGEKTIGLHWTALPGAAKYKVFYDESALLKNDGADPLLDSDYITQTEFDVHDLSPATEYTFLVKGYDKAGKDIAKTLPLHAKTFKAVSFSLVGDPIATDDHTLQLVFTQPIDTQKTQIIIIHPKTKKTQLIDHIENSKEDLRSINIVTKKKLDKGIAYDMTLKKVFSQSGFEMPAENKTTLKVAYSGDLGQIPVIPAVTPTPSVDTTDDDTESKFDKPVPIDRLPQTGPAEITALLLLSLLLAFVIQKKLHKGA